MTAKERAIIGIMVFSAAGIFLGAFAAGLSAAKSQKEKEQQPVEVVYAEIISADNGFFRVKGLDVNDINGRGEFTFYARENTALIWRETEISLSDFQAGDRIAFFFTGEVLESFPAQVKNVTRIKLLDDEK